jgi:hypothetical protein
MSLIGSAGEVCNNLMVNGSRPGKPAFTITDDKDKVVENGNFEYGWGFTCSRSWRAPDDLKGTFTVSVQYNTDPFKTVVKDSTFTID